MSETSDFVEMWAKPPRPVSLAQFRGTIHRQVDNLLYEARREFAYLDSRTLAEAGVADGELRLRGLAWSVIVLPDTDTLPDAAWANLERSWKAGGVVVAAGALPLNSERQFPSARVCRRAARLFGRESVGVPPAPSWAGNAAGGLGIYLPLARIPELPGVLDALLEPDVRVGDAATPLRIARRAVDGLDVFFVINDSPQPWQGSLAFGQAHERGERLDPATGTLQRLPDPTRVDLDLEGWGAAIVRLAGVARVSRRPLDHEWLGRLAAD